MTIVFFEINLLHSLMYRQIIPKEKYLETFLKSLSRPKYLITIRNVLKREFQICDVAGGQFGKPPELTKGNPHL